MAKEHILFVLTTADKQVLQNGKVRKTGFFLNEFYVPYKEFINAGHEISFATIKGNPAPVDPESLKSDYWNDVNLTEEALEFTRNDPNFIKPKSLLEILNNLEDYDAIVIPGGQGVMVDLIENKTISQILLKFALSQKPIGLICHSPALLINVAKFENNPMKGFDVTSVSIFEELYIEYFIMKGKAKHRMIRHLLDDHGYDSHSALPKMSHVEKDRFLVTNQNPFSSEEFSEVFLKTLEEYSRK
jgi:putative intracellular protease/amidase